MRKILFFAALALLSSIAYAQSADLHKSPEAVAARFVECVKIADFDNMLELYAYHNDAIVKNIDPKAFLQRLNALTPSSAESVPADYFRIKQVRMSAAFTWQVSNLIYTVLLPEQFDNFINYSTLSFTDDPELIDTFLQSLDIKHLKKLELVRMDMVSPDLQKSERHRSNVSKLQKIYKFDDKIEYTVLYKLDDSYYEGGITFSKFGDKWYIDSLSSSLANIQPLKKVENLKRYLSDCGLPK